jgi:hypothetical protein
VRLLVAIPCRNEALVLPRKLANLARCTWPAAPAGEPHRVVVVDDDSSDGSAALARATGLDVPGVELSVRANHGKAGKAGAIACALELARPADLVVLTDADVIVAPEALCALVRAFARDPQLGMACGAQEFVCDLAADGSARGAGGGEPRPAGGLYDWVTARVRSFESRAGMLFSVHGQLLAWRAGLGLAPTPGIAADDLDLMLQARARGARVCLVAEARFFEVKLAPGERRDGQALRRARAYFQALRRPLPARRKSGLAGGLQLALYRYLPGMVPWLCLCLAAFLAVLAFVLGGPAVLLAVLCAGATLALLPVGRRFLWLCDVIVRAGWRERGAPLSDRWEMERT